MLFRSRGTDHEPNSLDSRGDTRSGAGVRCVEGVGVSEPIQVGDLVVVVRWPHPCRQQYLGKIYTVRGIILAGIKGQDCGEDLVR